MSTIRTVEAAAELPVGLLSPNDVTSGAQSVALRSLHQIAHHTRNVQLCFNNFVLNEQGTLDPGNTLTIEHCYIEDAATNRAYQVTFDGGNSSKTLTDGQHDVLCDPVPAVTFGEYALKPGRQLWVKTVLSVPNAADSLPRCDRFLSALDGQQCEYFDSANTTISNIGAAGEHVFSGDAPVPQTTGYIPFLVGVPLSDTASFVILGSSTSKGVGDSTDRNQFIRGGLSKSLRTDNDQYPLPSLYIGRSGGFTSLYSNSAKLREFFKYGKFAIHQIGTNDVRTEVPQATIESNIASYLPELEQQVDHIYFMELLTRTFGSFNTLAGQTLNTSSQVGAGKDVYEAYLQELVAGNPTIRTYVGSYNDDVIILPKHVGEVIGAETVTAADIHKWRPDRTSDGLHMNSTGHADAAIALRQVFDAAT